LVFSEWFFYHNGEVNSIHWKTFKGFSKITKTRFSSMQLLRDKRSEWYRALRYFARLPTHFAESGSLSLCTVHFLLLPSDPAVASNALAIRIVFPLVGVTPASRRLGLPAMPGKQKCRALFLALHSKISIRMK
jgi:hypothetical protein